MKKTIIVGAGIAGITAAVELSKNNITPIVLEERKFPGGRTFSFKDDFTGDIIDNGQHLLMGAYVNFLNLLDTLGTAEKLLFTKGIRIPFIDKYSESSLFNTEIFPGKSGLLFAMINFKGLSLFSKWKAIKFLISIGTGKKEFIQYSVSELFDQYQISDELIKRFFEPLCLATMNAKSENASANIFIQVIKKALFSKGDYSKLIYPGAGLSELIKPFEEIIKKVGGEVHYSTGIEEIMADKNKILAVKSKSQTFLADYYIFAIPANKLSSIVNGSHSLSNVIKLQEFQYSPIISIYLWYDREFIKSKITAVIDSNIQWIFNKRRIYHDIDYNKDMPGHYAVTISGADDLINLPKDLILQTCLDEIGRIFPESKKSELKHSVVIKEKNATVLLNPDSLKYRKSGNSNYKNLFFAGDWTDTGLPATIESACLSGIKAAQKIMNFAG
ncbi:MAG: hydroxysqualene dehydroxylase HpnE [bacterium]